MAAKGEEGTTKDIEACVAAAEWRAKEAEEMTEALWEELKAAQEELKTVSLLSAIQEEEEESRKALQAKEALVMTKSKLNKREAMVASLEKSLHLMEGKLLQA